VAQRHALKITPAPVIFFLRLVKDRQSLEDNHHIFVHCPFFQDLRDEYSELLFSETTRILIISDSTLPVSTLSHLVRFTRHLFRDDSFWPLASSRFYLGLLPPLLPKPSLTIHSQPSPSLTVSLLISHTAVTFMPSD
jgi:hypothetical protein